MASIVRPHARSKDPAKKFIPGKSRFIIWFTEYRFKGDKKGKRKKVVGTTDRRETQRIAHELEKRSRKVQTGEIDPKVEKVLEHLDAPIDTHLDAWFASMQAKDLAPRHCSLSLTRAKRVIAFVKGSPLHEIEPADNAKHAEMKRIAQKLDEVVKSATLGDLDAESVQRVLKTLKDHGRSNATLNHHRQAVRAFTKWCVGNNRLRDDPLQSVVGYNAEKDKRHERRSISEAELLSIIAAAQNGPVVMGMTGPQRALAYRVAALTGLRYGVQPGEPRKELAYLRSSSFDWSNSTITIPAGYTKNGDPATIDVPDELMAELRRYVADCPAGQPIFPLRAGKGAVMLRYDLDAAGVPYRDAAGRVFDFHCLRGMMATMGDAAGVPLGVNQRRMRHSTSKLTEKYIRPRSVDIKASANKLPSLTPVEDESTPMKATGTDSRFVSATNSATLPIGDDSDHRRKSLAGKGGATMSAADDPQIRSPRLYPLSYGRLYLTLSCGTR
jgi:integrase